MRANGGGGEPLVVCNERADIVGQTNGRREMDGIERS
jgi:hypothetical protein